MASKFHCVRSIVIDAPADAILPEVADLKRHVAWSPFSRPDPKVKDAYQGGPGVGQSRDFAGGKLGAGAIRIESVAPDSVRMILAMRKPMRATNTIDFDFTPEAGGTRVSWSLTGPMTLIARIMGLFMDCDAMCGRMLDEGLAGLKSVTERKLQQAL